MNKVKIAGLGLVAVCALYAVFATSALAASEWLWNGSAVTSELPVHIEVHLTLIKLSAVTEGSVLNEALCSFLFYGVVIGRLLFVTKPFSLFEEAIGELGMTNEKSANCEVTFDAGAIADCKAGTVAKVWMDNLNVELEAVWEGEIESMTSSTLLVFGKEGKEPGFDIECESLLGVRGSELCEGLTSALLENAGEGVTAEFASGAPVESEAINCTLTGEKTDHIVAVWTITHLTGGILTVS